MYEYVRDFEKLGFGMFVHFGLYSVIGKGEWIQHIGKIPSDEYAKLTEDRGITIVDISDVPRSELTDFEFYISSKEPLESFVGCTFEDYEQKDGFWTYKIKPLTNIMRFDNV